jgi:DNA-binding transcriptional MerR regulator
MRLTLEQLAEKISSWCQQHRVLPANGQVATDTQPRTLRYYRTLGLLDAPAGAGVYLERHFLQACAVRILQAEGLPLTRIHSLLFARSDDELREMLQAAESRRPAQIPRAEPAAEADSTSWQTQALGSDFLLVSRRPHHRLTEAQIRDIRDILNSP